MNSGGRSADPFRGAREDPRRGRLARRFLARLIDGVIAVGGSSLSFAAVYSPEPLGRLLTTGIFTGTVLFVYFVAFECTLGWTPAKKLLGLAVRGSDGVTKPTIAESAIRNAYTLLPAIPCVGSPLAFVAVATIGLSIDTSRTKQGVHDRMAHTYVVRS